MLSNHVAVLADKAAVLTKVSLNFNTNGIPGLAELNHLLGGLGTLCEILALAGFVISSGVWALAHHGGNHDGMSAGRRGVLVSVAAAFLIGGAATLINFFLGAGARI
jgi:hypothetical protein